MRFLSFLLPLFLLPTFIFAAEFAKGSLFLSQESVTEGETVFIHAVISSETAFEGALHFREEEKEIGTVAIKLAAGEAKTASLSWTPAVGSHEIFAELKKDGEILETHSATFNVAAKVLAQTDATTTSIESSQNLQNTIANYSPTTASTLAPAFEFLDSARTKGVEVLGSQIESAKQKISKAKEDSSGMGTASSILYTIYLYLLTILTYLLSNVALFYPFLALLFFYLLWKTFKKIRRPA